MKKDSSFHFVTFGMTIIIRVRAEVSGGEAAAHFRFQQKVKMSFRTK